MKKTGWTILVFGCLSLMGILSKGGNPMGPSFWIALGIYIVHRANQKDKEKKDRDKWMSQ